MWKSKVHRATVTDNADSNVERLIA